MLWAQRAKTAYTVPTRIDFNLLRRALAALPLPHSSDGRIILAVDVSPWLRPDAPTSPQRAFCHVYGRGKNQAQLIPGWPYSFVAVLEPGRTSWTAVLDAVRLHPDDDDTTVTATQVRGVVGRLRAAGQHRDGDPDILLVFDAGYELARLAFLLADLPLRVVASDAFGPGAAAPGAVAGSDRAPTPARCRVPVRGPGDLARTRRHHSNRDGPLRHGYRRCME
ncbi:transposase [Rhodococcus sp. ARC_M6]|nr:transposase [Rhodococcus sp. ARC_M6]